MNHAADKFLYRVSEHLFSRFGSDLEHVAVVFNNKRPSLFMRKYLSEIIGKPAWSPSFFTIQQFFSEATGRLTASPLKQFFALHAAYNEILRQEGVPRIGAAAFYPVAEVILADFSQVDYYLADAADVFRLIGQYAEIQQQFPNFDEEQLAFLESFWSSFSADRQSDLQQRFIQLWKRMPQLYRAFHERLADQGLCSQAGLYRQSAEQLVPVPERFHHVAFVGFNALSKAEEKLFRHWQDIGRASFYFDADAHYLDDPRQEAGHFIRRNTRTVGLVNALPVIESRINDPEKRITLVKAIGNTTQGKLLRALDASVSEGAGQKAIILADESLLLPVIQTLEGDDLNITMGYPFRQSLVFGLCNLWLSVQEELARSASQDVPYPLVLKWLSHPFVSPPVAERDRIWNEVIGKRMVRVPVSLLWTADETSVNFFVAAEPGVAIVERLKALLSSASVQAGIRWLEKRLIAEAIKALNMLADNLRLIAAEEKEELKPAFLFRMIRRSLEALSVPFEGEPLSGLQVMGLLESRCLDFDELIVLGMNEGVLPKISTAPTFIPDNLRRAFGLPVLENQNAIFAYFFYRLLQGAKKVTLVYNGITDEQSTGEASRFIRQLQFETRCRIEEVSQQDQPVQVTSDRSITVPKEGPVWNKLQRYFNSSGLFSEEKISASAFTDYISCPLKFFFGRIVGLKEPEDLPDQVEARLVGSMLHRVMELVYGGMAGVPASTGFIRQKEKELPAICLQALTDILLDTTGSKPLKPNAMQQVVLRVLERYAINILQYDEEMAPFTIRELENKSDYRYRVEVRVGEHRQGVWLYGIIDRIDERAGRLRIIDYKTGKDKVSFKDLDDLFDENSRTPNKALVQTLFYTWIVEQVKGISGVEPHLYTVRSFKERTLFRDAQKVVLEDEALAAYKKGFEARMVEKLNELFDPQIPFRQTTNPETCTYCPYNEICQRQF